MRVTNQYSDEFRSDALNLIRRGDRSLNQVARDLGVSHWTLRGWVKNQHMAKRRKKESGKAAAADPASESPQQRIERLERENERLRKENDSLRLSAANLPKHTFLPPEGVNVYDILRHDHLVLSQDAAKALEERCLR